MLGPKVVEAPRRRPRPHRVLVGACVDEERVEDAFDWSGVDPARRLVYCSVGSHGRHWNAEIHTRLIRSVVEAFRALPGYAVLLQTSSVEEAQHVEPLPENVLAAPWYPQLQVLARASLAITHGGFGSVREALFHGVPMIVFPHGVDQPGNAARVARLGVGLVGDIRSVTPASIRRMVRVIEMPSYRESARRLSRELRADNTCSAAVALIDRLLPDGGRGARSSLSTV